MDTILHQYAIYDHPKDYPDKFVMRRFDIYPGKAVAGPLVGTADSLEEIRDLLPNGLICFERFDQDDPVIVEVWM